MLGTFLLKRSEGFIYNLSTILGHCRRILHFRLTEQFHQISLLDGEADNCIHPPAVRLQEIA